jgi:hypothetical protein
VSNFFVVSQRKPLLRSLLLRLCRIRNPPPACSSVMSVFTEQTAAHGCPFLVGAWWEDMTVFLGTRGGGEASPFHSALSFTSIEVTGRRSEVVIAVRSVPDPKATG